MSSNLRASDNNGLQASLTAAISILPSEILLHIFLVLQRECFALHEFSASTTISTVCRHWRWLAMQYPLLWSFIRVTEFSHPMTILQDLRLSGSSGLHISFCGPTRNADFSNSLVGHARFLSDYSDRFVEFHVVDLDPDEIESILFPFAKPAPRLRSMHIETNQLPAFPERQSVLFGGATPGLHDLTIVTMPISLDPYVNLCELVLKNQSELAAEKLLSALRRCPRLQMLTLEFIEPIFPADMAYDEESFSPVYLQRLRLLTMSALQDDVLHMLAHLVFPHMTVTDLRLLGPTELPLSTDIIGKCHSFHAITANVSHVYLEIIEVRETCGVRMTSGDSRMTVLWEWFAEGEDDYSSGQAQMRFDLMHLAALERLTVEALPWGTEVVVQEWARLIDLVPTINTLEIIASYVVLQAETLGALFYVLSAPIGDVWQPSIRCAYLTNLVLWSSWFFEDGTLEALASCFEAREEYGARLESLEITLNPQIQYPEELMERVNAIAADVVPFYLDNDDSPRQGIDQETGEELWLM